MSQTIQRGDQGKFGTAYLINPITMDTKEILNKMTCFVRNGSSSDSPVTPQIVLPDLTDFQYIRSDIIEGRICQKWRAYTEEGPKTNEYIMWVTDDDLQTPVKYEMMGYDSMFGSHYDKYFIVYNSFSNLNPPDESIFPIKDSLQPCEYFVDGHPIGAAETAKYFNPMREFVHGDESLHEKMFEKFKKTHNVKYENENHEA